MISGSDRIRVLALSGSLRAASTNASLLLAASLLAPANTQIELYPGIGGLPHFNPDLDTSDQDNPPQIVREFRETVDRADGLLISCPEYARGIPGSFKNALDWLVGSPTFFDKPVALLNASPRAREMDACAIANDPSIGPLLTGALLAFRQAILAEDPS